MIRSLSCSLAVSIASIFLSACSPSIAAPSSPLESAPGSTSPAIALTGTVWKLQSLQRSDSTSVQVPDPNRFTLELSANGQMAVRADCNRCSGSYSQTDTTFAVNPAVACTRAFCSSAPFDQEYLTVLVDTTVARINGGTLECVSPRGVLTFAR